jgi:streptogramin lyase
VGEGAVWVPSNGGELARLDPSTGSVEQYIPLPPDAFGGNLVTGFGSVWIPEQLLGVAQLNPVTNRAVGTIPITQNGLTLATNEVAVASGELWVSGQWSQPVTDEGGNTSLELIESWAVASIDPTTGKVTSITSVATPSALVAGAGLLWVVNSEGVPTWQIQGGRLAHLSGLKGKLVAIDSDRVWVLTRGGIITARSTTNQG